MKRKLNELEFNETLKCSEMMPGLEGIMGENMKFVGRSYIFVGDNDIMQTIKIWAVGFNPEDYDQD